MSFTLYPAIDVRQGRVVRLRQGDYAQETRYEDAPLSLALRYAEAGARWLHLVDLDAARAGGYTLTALLRTLKAETPLSVQTGGGVRDEGDVVTLLEAGADRVVVGSLAVREPARVCAWIARYGAERITLALDVRAVGDAWSLPVAGWTTDSDRTLDTLLPRFAEAGARHLLCTDIGRDGMLSGPNLALYRMLAGDWPALYVQASGGIRDAADVAAARAAGCAGAVLGRALLEGGIALPDALREAA